MLWCILRKMNSTTMLVYNHCVSAEQTNELNNSYYDMLWSIAISHVLHLLAHVSIHILDPHFISFLGVNSQVFFTFSWWISKKYGNTFNVVMSQVQTKHSRTDKSLCNCKNYLKSSATSYYSWENMRISTLFCFLSAWQHITQ